LILPVGIIEIVWDSRNISTASTVLAAIQAFSAGHVTVFAEVVSRILVLTSIACESALSLPDPLEVWFSRD
jgi:hypothetical protein